MSLYAFEVGSMPFSRYLARTSSAAFTAFSCTSYAFFSSLFRVTSALMLRSFAEYADVAASAAAFTCFISARMFFIAVAYSFSPFTAIVGPILYPTASTSQEKRINGVTADFRIAFACLFQKQIHYHADRQKIQIGHRKPARQRGKQICFCT